MVPQPDVSPQTESVLRPEWLQFLKLHAEAVFDWSATRRSAVVTKSKERLNAFLDAKDSGKISGLWDNIVQSFTNESGPPVANRFIKAGNEIIGVFSPSELPTHSEYHIAKVITLTAELFERALPPELQTRENKLALTLSAVIHDIGSLQHVGEEGPQEKFYRFHELRAIAMVDTIVDKLQLEGYADESARGILKQKIKLLIAATIPKWNLDYAGSGTTMIQKLIGQKGQNMTEDDFITQLELREESKDDLETRGIKLENMKTAKELYALFQDQSSDEMLKLAEIMGAADHGAYLLEPARIAEIIGLWQELNRLWKNGKGELEHRPFGTSKNYLEYMLAGFPEYQWRTYGETLKKIGRNPFMDLSIEETKKYIDATTDLLNKRSGLDSLARFEGTFTPKDLQSLAERRGSKEVEGELLRYSEHFASAFHNAHDFYALSTPVLRAIYKAFGTGEKRAEFLKEALQIMVKESTFELTSGGSFVLHIAPLVYCEGTGESLEGFMNNLSTAYNSLSSEERRRIGQIYLTCRSDRGDDVDQLHKAILTTKGTNTDMPALGVAIGGKIERTERSLGDTYSVTVSENEEKQRTGLLVHYGMEDSLVRMGERLEALLKDINPEDPRFQFLSIHIDDHFDWFMDFYRNHEDHRPALKKLIKSVSPLGYLLTGDKNAFSALKEFFKEFPDAAIGSHNSCLLGSFGLSGQNLVKLLLSD